MGSGAPQGQRGQARTSEQGMSTPGLDLDALRTLLKSQGIDVAGNLVATALAGGRSNLTYKVHDENSAWVVRRPPLGGLTPSAHDMAREYRVTAALQSTPVPTAATVALDADGAVMGAPVSVVAFVPGTVVRSQDDLSELSDAQVLTATTALVECLVELHRIDHLGVGLGTFGRPEGFVGRQVALWARQWTQVAVQDLPDIDRLATLLTGRVPPTSAAAILHGDFRIDNTILDLSGPDTVSAVVDWEMSTIGDPLTDLALMCVYRSPVFDTVLGMPAAWTSPRLPGSDDLAEQYAQASGRDLGDWNFYLALAFFKLAVIAEGIAHRARVCGADAEATGSTVAEATPVLVDAGLQAISR
jgi:aminoglycoside phosphotransferase (APT) family kinase protein